ncbi:SH3 domain containing protein [Blumeria hordei DH14]|uniref:SH3 domain containing protein n=1 Tax=Blumeria graminis f. sp. hordei (strain DH14) TaxID=546991 RepID=N1JR28_BLUG1|nr:SH3 domain containing protein [Blumeria hordei DH14]
MNPSNIPYHFGEHDSQHKSDQSTSTLLVYVTTSATSSGPAARYTTLTSSKVTTSTQSTTQSSSTSSWTSTSVSVTTTPTETSSLPQTTSITSSSVSTTEYSTSISMTDQTLFIDTTSAPHVTSSSTMTSSEPATTTPIVTSLKDLPSSIESPTSTVPKSMPLLVATSSSSASTSTSTATTISTSQTSLAPFPKATETNRPVELPNSSEPLKSSSMTSTGKASLILGIVLLLGAILLMLQFYLKKKRDNGISKIQDDEKDGYRDMSQKASVPFTASSASNASSATEPGPNNQSDKNRNDGNSPVSNYDESEKRSLTTPTDIQPNPFGNHAEISVDSVNANGPNILNNPSPTSRGNIPVPMLVRGASKRSQRQQDFPKAPSPATSKTHSAHQINTPYANVKPQLSRTAQSTDPDIPIAVHRAQLDFAPSMDDELELIAGQLVRVLHEYDDGWAMCIRLDSSEQGVCPRTCLSTRPIKPRSHSGSSGGPSPGMQASQASTGLPQQSPLSVEKGPLPATPNRQGVPNQPSSPEQWSNSVNGQRRPQEPSSLTLGRPSPCDMEPRGLNMTHATLQTSSSSEHGELLDPHPANSESPHESSPLPLKNMARYNCKVNTQTVGNFSAHTPDGCTIESPIIQQFSTNKPIPEVPYNNNPSDSRPSTRNSEIIDDLEPYTQTVHSRSGSPSQHSPEGEYSQKSLPGQAL